MKHISYLKTSYRLALLMYLFSVQAKAQYNPFVGANAILLSTTMADKETYEMIAAVLTQQALSFTAVGNVLSIRSEHTSAGKGILFEGQLVINSGVIKLTGFVLEHPTSSASVAAQSTPVIFARRRASPQRLAFLYMDTLARKLQSVLRGSIAYKSQV